MLASHMALPRRGDLDQLYHIFAYLNKHHNSEIVFDPTPPEIPDNLFGKHDWLHTVYGNCHEELPNHAHTPRGSGFIMRAYVDSDHAGDSTNRRSRTGFIVYLNSSPICYHSKKQTNVETRSFGSEFVALKTCCEYIRGLRYKLRMMGIPVDLPTYIFEDNQSVLKNSTLPDFVLQKKSSSIAYHFIREGVPRREWLLT